MHINVLNTHACTSVGIRSKQKHGGELITFLSRASLYLLTGSWNCRHARDATLLTGSWNCKHARDVTLLTGSWNFRHARGATRLISYLSCRHACS